MVHKDDEGFTVGPKERKLGIKGSPTTELYFENCRIPGDRIIGEPGTGFKTALATLDHTRPTIGAQAVGIAQGALDAAIAYTKERKQFGKSISDFQGVQFMLADMAMKIEAARLMVYTAAARAERGEPALGLHLVGVEVLCLRRGHGGDHRRRAVVRRRRLHHRLPGRADDARRQDHPDLRGHQPDSAGRDGARAARLGAIDPGRGVRWHTKPMTAVAPTARTYELIAAIADRLALEIDETVAAMDAAVIEVVPEFGADAAIAAELTATNRGNWQRFLAVARQAQSPLSDAVPPEALDAARTVVRRGIDLDRIYEGYRRGQQVGLERWLACAYEIVEPGPELIGVTELSLSLAFRFIDQTLGRVLAEAQREREEVIGGALARRTETIRLILDGAPIDPTAASRRLGYELDRRHTAVVVWAESAVAPHGALESAAVLLAQAAGSQRPLTLPAGTTTLWAWIGTPGEPAIEDLRSAVERSPDDVRAAVGPTRRGIEGFRDSHEAALTVHRLLLGNPASGRFGSYRELEVTALAAHDPRAASEFIAATLGPLAEDSPAAARLRETLRVYLEEADNAPRAAARLYTHRNTVLKRIARATELLGYAPGERRLAVELALELRRHLPPPAS